MQALTARLLVAHAGGAAAVAGALLMHEQGWCLGSTLGRRDTFALCQLSACALLPAVHAATQPSLNSRLSSTLGCSLFIPLWQCLTGNPCSPTSITAIQPCFISQSASRDHNANSVTVLSFSAPFPAMPDKLPA